MHRAMMSSVGSQKEVGNGSIPLRLRRFAESHQSRPIRLLLVDDHVVVRAGLRSLLRSSGKIQVVREARRAADAVRQATALHPNVVLISVRVPGVLGPGVLGIEACREIRRRHPGIHTQRKEGESG